MDIRLPDVDGLEFVKEIKELNGGVGIIVLTGSVSIDNAVKLLRDREVLDFLTKPLENKSILTDSVRQALQKRRMIVKRKGN